jgi:hypothetical protein
MYFTEFAPIFLCLFVFALFGVNNFARALGVSSFFAAASPILLSTGGRVAGIPPAYLIMFIGLAHVYMRLFSKRYLVHHKKGFYQLEVKVLFAFTIIAIAGAIILPRIFAGDVDILDPKKGLDSGFTEPLSPKGTNYTQAFYLVCIFLLFSSLRYLLSEGLMKRDAIFQGILFGGGVSLCLGFYQIIAYQFNLPWPNNVINSNLGLPQSTVEQTLFGIKRVSSTFSEPSIMAVHFVSIFGFFALGLKNYLAAGLFLIIIILTTSSTAYFGIIILFALWALLDIRRNIKTVMLLSFLLFSCVVFAIILDNEITNGQILRTMLLEKAEGQSAKVRMYADTLALGAFLDSWGLGVGAGSMRSSSFFTTALATYGLVGTLALAIFWGVVLISCLRSHNKLDRAIFFGIFGFMSGWLLSVPDINFSLIWLFAATAPSWKDSVVKRSNV